MNARPDTNYILQQRTSLYPPFGGTSCTALVANAGSLTNFSGP